MTAASSPDVLVFIPSFNDMELVPDIVDRVEKLDGNFRILIIDDGSEPALDIGALSNRCLFFRLPTNFGLGTSTHIAIDLALALGCKIMVRVDSDGQHPVERIPDLLTAIETGGCDLAVGGRTNRDEGSSLRSLAARLTRGYLSLVAGWLTKGQSPKDVNSGFLALGSNAMRVLNQFRLERFPEPQIFVLAGRQGLVIKEVEIEQSLRTFGKSSVSLNQALRLMYRFNIFVLAELLQGTRKS
jgi:glycosyltransferase involved in cell wall biosynthesis